MNQIFKIKTLKKLKHVKPHQTIVADRQKWNRKCFSINETIDTINLIIDELRKKK